MHSQDPGMLKDQELVHFQDPRLLKNKEPTQAQDPWPHWDQEFSQALKVPLHQQLAHTFRIN